MTVTFQVVSLYLLFAQDLTIVKKSDTVKKVYPGYNRVSLGILAPG